jgi:hypothetical protein
MGTRRNMGGTGIVEIERGITRKVIELKDWDLPG